VHAEPQAPQWVFEVVRSTSQPSAATPLQSAKPLAQAPTTHAPAAQALTVTFASAHAASHAPQCRGSVMGDTQPPPQLVRPAPHEAAQAPALHTWPLAQRLPHAPQSPLSRCRSRQVPAQLVSPAPHDTTHAPREHSCPAAQLAQRGVSAVAPVAGRGHSLGELLREGNGVQVGRIGRNLFPQRLDQHSF
jgi:hypothetical protein